MRKEVFKSAAALALIISAICMPAKAAVDTKDKFKDIRSDNWFYSQVLRLNSIKAISGFPDGTFRPYNNITRAEFVKVLMDAFKIPVEDGYYYSDTKEHWAYSYISTASAKGIIPEGMAKDKFLPDRLISRIDMAAIVLSMLNIQNIKGDSPFDDISHDIATTAFKERLITGNIKNGKRLFQPDSKVTRAEASAVVVRALDYFENPEVYIKKSEIQIVQQEKEIKKQKEEIKKQQLYNSLVKSSAVVAQITENSKLYSSYYSPYNIIGTLNAGTKVEIIYGMYTEWFYVAAGKIKGWVPRKALFIPADPPTNTKKMTKDQIEGFVNYKGFKSNSPYLVWIDIDRQLTYVLSGSQGNWKLNRTILCATGRNDAPTIRGTYTISRRGNWFYYPRYKSGAKYWVEFNGDYLFHSVTFDASGNIKDDTLGKRASSGCVRMSVEDSSWFYNYIPKDTTVWVN
ncbi:MAG TPA: S-layer homology domain-containing protein [Pseudobacteroides sp.]|uniref:S-layer homology domain-containing protein n=1 Tax=Pseudobacteroides sp. TaxID=1968840 RepID=UPI002F92DA2E